jgi:hypothetical protein
MALLPDCPPPSPTPASKRLWRLASES